jgi:hypothetical protein
VVVRHNKFRNRVIQELYKVEIDAKAEVLEVFSPLYYSGEGSSLD